MALERGEAPQRPVVAGDDELDAMLAGVVATDGEPRPFERLRAAMPRGRGGRGGRLISRLAAAGEGEQGGEDDSRANSRRR
jgi:hypothetical protein